MVPFRPFLGEGSPTKIDYRKKGTLNLTSLLENLVNPKHMLRRQGLDPQATLKHGMLPHDGVVLPFLFAGSLEGPGRLLQGSVF